LEVAAYKRGIQIIGPDKARVIKAMTRSLVRP